MYKEKKNIRETALGVRYTYTVGTTGFNNDGSLGLKL